MSLLKNEHKWVIISTRALLIFIHTIPVRDKAIECRNRQEKTSDFSTGLTYVKGEYEGKKID